MLCYNYLYIKKNITLASIHLARFPLPLSNYSSILTKDNTVKNWGRNGFDVDYKPQGACRDGNQSRKIKIANK